MHSFTLVRTRRHCESRDVYQALGATGLFARTDPAVVSDFSTQLEPQRFPRGHRIDAQSDFDGHVYVIVSGKAELTFRCPDGREIGLTVLGPSQIFGVKTLFDPDSRGFSLTTLTDVVVAPIARDQLLVWMAKRPEIGEQLLRLFARWAREAANSLVDFALADARSRTASRLLMLSQRFGWRDGDAVRVVHDMALTDFAMLVGAAPRVVDATLRDFAECGSIRLERGSVVITDAQALDSAARGCGDRGRGEGAQ
ncbi:Crp/Fnr family transcriptional regulator [Mycobacterium colombiense]|uniref:Crp/Fnr family transcriptional regulator n=1 Tax=Mycobacterium colombiense TaxID=339268 RepID=A0A329L9X7_9MYCO|nr:Crp/Fnr family transcriptional regulator [Mycobacterium colombiense]